MSQCKHRTVAGCMESVYKGKLDVVGYDLHSYS
jgi:hypothetical protein